MALHWENNWSLLDHKDNASFLDRYGEETWLSLSKATSIISWRKVYFLLFVSVAFPSGGFLSFQKWCSQFLWFICWCFESFCTGFRLVCDCLFPNKKLASVRKDLLFYWWYWLRTILWCSFSAELISCRFMWPILVGAYAQEVLLPLGC